MAYSPNKKFLISGLGDFPLNINIYNVDENYTKRSSFKKNKNTTKAVAFLDNKTAISAGGNNNEIYIWDRDSTRVKRKIEGVGATVWSVGLNENSIAWGNKADIGKNNNFGTLKKIFRLKTFKVKEKSRDFKKFKKLSTKNGDYSLTLRARKSILDIKKDGKVVASIHKNSTNGRRHKCYGFYKNYIVSGGGNGNLIIYNLQGIKVAKLEGHMGEIWSIGLYKDRLVSGSEDQIIIVWDLSKLKEKRLQINEKHINLMNIVNKEKLTRKQII